MSQQISLRQMQAFIMLSPSSHAAGFTLRAIIALPIIAISINGFIPFSPNTPSYIALPLIAIWFATLMWIGYKLISLCCNIAGTGFFAEIEKDGSIGLHHSLWGPKLNSKMALHKLNTALSFVLQHDKRRRPIAVLSPVLREEKHLRVLAALVARSQPGCRIEIVRNVQMNHCLSALCFLRHWKGTGEFKWQRMKNGITIQREA